MSNVAQQVIDTILEKARTIARSETLLGEPIKFNDLLVVPVIQVSIGFGAGGGDNGGKGDSDKNTLSGGGGGGGIKIEPSCFLVHDGTTVRVLPAKASKAVGVDALVEKLPDLLTYAMDSLRTRGDKNHPEEETRGDAHKDNED